VDRKLFQIPHYLRKNKDKRIDFKYNSSGKLVQIRPELISNYKGSSSKRWLSIGHCLYIYDNKGYIGRRKIRGFALIQRHYIQDAGEHGADERLNSYFVLPIVRIKGKNRWSWQYSYRTNNRT